MMFAYIFNFICRALCGVFIDKLEIGTWKVKIRNCSMQS
jgi:hypothetical protein